MAAEHRFGRYRVTKTLGSGAMGDVYEAVDDVLGREVAIKTLKTSSGGVARLLDDRFRQEARAIAQLSHPGIVQVFDIDLAAEAPYLVMERVAGPSLDQRLAEGPLSVADVIPLGIQIARALAAAHAAGIVHRDVKPANILAAGPGTWKLADFGVAHVPDSSLTITGQFFGSPAYAPPEALVKGIVAAAGDIYGLGATLYQAVAGTWPRLEKKGALLAPIPPLHEIAPHVPPAICDALDRAVSFEADARPTADELAHLLAHAAAPNARPSTPEVERARPEVERASERWRVGADPSASPAVSMPGVQVPTRPFHWKPWAIGAGVALAILLIASLKNSGDGTARPSTVPSALPIAGVPGTPSSPDEIVVKTPPGIQGKSAKEWNRIVDELRRRHYEGARHRLDQWEQKYFTTPETQDLRNQLDNLPADMRSNPEHRNDD